ATRAPLQRSGVRQERAQVERPQHTPQQPRRMIGREPVLRDLETDHALRTLKSLDARLAAHAGSDHRAADTLAPEESFLPDLELSDGRGDAPLRPQGGEI